MRIVAGRWRGRTIAAPRGTSVRPTADRVREAWMSILQNDLPGATILDLFSGSGALGLEALSRGASHATFVESAASSLASLRSNIEQLGASDAATVVRMDALRFLDTAGELTYDVAFADPPYRKELATRVAERWRDVRFSRILAIEHASTEAIPSGGDTRRYGSTALTFYRA
ncbi:MAG TPA: 16S rRNA (guanine(966)-N(2))-methyltransferase RsmD [Gemmatimonadaceae bacterium]|nr:16S rRNA (guanine(966)-N(2))-methyltransferase RsmD [Gemmatimonadaceae bacterium]